MTVSTNVSVFALAVKIEEEKPVLKETFLYVAPNFQHRLTTNESRPNPTYSTDLSVHIGQRRFHQIHVITYSEQELAKLAEDLNTSAMDTKPGASVQADDSQFKIFLSGNPTVERTEGIIHLYKDCQELNLSTDAPRSNMLCIIGVPTYMTVRDIMDFTTPMRDSIEQLKIIKDGTPNQFMVLLKFKSQRDADQFYNTFNTTQYNSVESEVCQMAYVSHVEAITPSLGAVFPIENLTELPSCPVCLERLDEPLQGILTILCNHSFHGSCISRMSETTCPVCRYMQTPETVGDSACALCDIRENLWICLICGHVGCGRYGRKHAEQHFQETGHTFALELGKNLVWDYADDAYVHRLIANQTDGKLVQVGEHCESGDKKLSSLSLEFTALLTSQLESQRMYFEGELARIEVDYTGRIAKAESRAAGVMVQAESAAQTLAELRKERQAIERKLNQTTAQAARLERELRDERELNVCLRANQVDWAQKLRDSETRRMEEGRHREAEMRDLQEQLTDLMLNLEMRTKLAEATQREQVTEAELADSEMVVTEGAAGHAIGESDGAKRIRRKKRH